MHVFPYYIWTVNWVQMISTSIRNGDCRTVTCKRYDRIMHTHSCFIYTLDLHCELIDPYISHFHFMTKMSPASPYPLLSLIYVLVASLMSLAASLVTSSRIICVTMILWCFSIDVVSLFHWCISVGNKMYYYYYYCPMLRKTLQNLKYVNNLDANVHAYEK